VIWGSQSGKCDGVLRAASTRPSPKRSMDTPLVRDGCTACMADCYRDSSVMLHAAVSLGDAPFASLIDTRCCIAGGGKAASTDIH